MGLHLTSCIIEETKIWMLVPELSILCCMDKETYSLRYVENLFDGVSGGEAHAYSKIIRNGQYIYALPDCANDIVVYNIISKELKHIIINWDYSDRQSVYSKTGQGFCREKKIYIVGDRLPIIIKFDTVTLEQQIIPLEVKNTMWNKSCQVANDLFIPSLESTDIVIFHMDTDTYDIKKIPIHTKGIASIQCLDGKIFIIPTDSPDIYELDKENWRVRRIFELKNIEGLKSNNENVPFMHLFKQNGFFWVLPWNANMIVRISSDAKEARNVYEYYDTKHIKYIKADLWDENHIFGYYSYGDSLDLLDTRTGKLKRIPNPFPHNFELYWKERIEKGNYVVMVNERQMDLQEFLNVICFSEGKGYTKAKRSDWKMLLK